MGDMFNETVLNYLRKYKDKYDINDLKNEILSKGYSEADYLGALKALEAENASGFNKISANKLPSSHYVPEKKGFSFFWAFVFILFFLIVLGFGVFVVLNYFDISLFGFNVFDYFD